jgi:hypothetical protein
MVTSSAWKCEQMTGVKKCHGHSNITMARSSFKVLTTLMVPHSSRSLNVWSMTVSIPSQFRILTVTGCAVVRRKKFLLFASQLWKSESEYSPLFCNVTGAYYKLWYDDGLVIWHDGQYNETESITVPAGQVLNPSINTNCSSGHEFRLELQTDDWGQEVSWKLESSNGNIVLQGGDYFDDTFLIEITQCLEDDGVHTFTILDSYGDGMCCGTFRYSLAVRFGNMNRPFPDCVIC